MRKPPKALVKFVQHLHTYLQGETDKLEALDTAVRAYVKTMPVSQAMLIKAQDGRIDYKWSYVSPHVDIFGLGQDV